MTLGVICILLGLSIPDFLKQKIPVWMLEISCVIAAVLRIVMVILGETDISLMGFLAALLPGCVLLLLAFVTREQIGYGDGMVLMIIGILYPVWRVMMVTGISLFIISIISIFVLLLRKGSRNTRLPFIPFLFLGSLIESGLRVIENG